jgi:prevent-host-death family protein
MSKNISSHEAEAKFTELLQRVESGEAFTITDKGKPVAEIVPHCSGDRSNVKGAIERILHARKSHLSNDALKTLRDTGHQ